MRSASSVAHQCSPAFGRRSFLGRATALGVGASAQMLLSSAPAWAAGDTTKKRDLVVLQPSDITGLDPHAATHTSDIAVSFNLFDTRYVDFTPNPDQQLELRRFNFRMRRV